MIGPKEDCISTIDDLLKTRLGIEFDLEITKCYRMGSFLKVKGGQSKPRPIFVTFAKVQERDLVWKKKMGLKKSQVFMAPDLPQVIEDRRARLLPIFKAAKSKVGYQKATYLTEDKLSINKKTYGIHNLKDLPEDLNPAKLATQTNAEVTLFFTRDSVLSNHYMEAPFNLDEKDFSCRAILHVD